LSNIGEESENKSASVENSSSAAESASLPSRSETPHQISGDGKTPTHKRKCTRNNQGPASAVASVLEKFLDSTKPQEPNLDPIHHFFVSMEETFKTFPPDTQVKGQETIFHVITAAKQSLLQRGQTSTRGNCSYGLEQCYDPSFVNQHDGCDYIYKAQ
jgi:hypothetical protein